MSILLGAIAGAAIGFSAINVMALVAKNSGKPCDTIQFNRQDSIWTDVDDWARRSGYAIKQDTGSSRRYQKGKNILTAPVLVDVSQEGTACTIKACVQINGGIVKGDIALSAPGILAKLPRATGKKEINTLLRELGAPQIV